MRLAIQGCPEATSRREHLILTRIVNDADHKFAGYQKAGSGNAVSWHVVDVVAGSIERIDNPGWWSVGGDPALHRARRVFFSQRRLWDGRAVSR